jgi:hypothetical protein
MSLSVRKYDAIDIAIVIMFVVHKDLLFLSIINDAITKGVPKAIKIMKLRGMLNGNPLSDSLQIYSSILYLI